MAHLEEHYEEWKEVRSRDDSIANAIFLIVGGALSLSITVIISAKANGLVTAAIADSVVSAWYWLFATILIFLVLKAKLILQSHLLHFRTAFHNKWLAFQNNLGWLIGIAGFIAFVVGMVQMVSVAVAVVVCT